MAKTLYLPDDSCEVVIGDEKDFLQRLIYERLGSDCEQLFLSVADGIKDEVEDWYRDKDEKEEDGYYSLCHEAVDGIDECLKLFEEPRLNRKKLKEQLQSTRDSLWNNM